MTQEEFTAAILPLDWRKNKAFQYAEGIGTQYEYWYEEQRYAVVKYGYAQNKVIQIDEAEALARADHEKNVLALFDLSLITPKTTDQ